MKHVLLFLVPVVFAVAARAQAPKPAGPAQPDAVAKLAKVPENLKKPIATIAEGFPTFEAKKFPKAPADTGYVFRNNTGTVDVGFQDGQVVYMVFKMGVGQQGLNASMAYVLHDLYSAKLLHEGYVGEKYRAAMVNAINAVVISRLDMDTNALTHGM